MIKRLSVFLILLTVLSCYKKDPITLRFMYSETKANELTVKNLISIFETENPGVKVIGKNINASRISKNDRKMTPGWDVLRFSSGLLESLALSGKIMKLDDFYSREFISLYYDKAFDAVRYNGYLWAVPDGIGDHLLLYFNKSMVGSKISDTETLIKFAKWRTEPSNGRYGLVFNIYEPYYFVPWISAFSNADLHTDKLPSLNSKGISDAFQFIYDLKNKYGIMPPVCDLSISRKMFADKNSAFTIDSESMKDTFKDALGTNLGISPLPTVSETKENPSSFVSARCLAVRKGLRGGKLKCSLMFVNFMASEISQKEWLKQGRLPSIRILENDGVFAKDPLLAASLEAVMKSRPKPVTSRLNILLRSIRFSLEKLLNSEISPRDAARDADIYLKELAKKEGPAIK